MRSTFSFLILFSGLCLLSFVGGCNQQTKDNKSKSESLEKPKSQVVKRNESRLRTALTKIDTNIFDEAYNKAPIIYLDFFPSSHAIACKMATMPYTTVKEVNQPYIDGQTYLGSADSAYLISRLKSLQPLLVNPDGGTAFGDFDCLASTDCLTLDAYRRIGIVCALKTDSNYLCHIMLSHKNWYDTDRGIILLITPNGEILEWMFSDGELTQGNPHGNIDRMFTIVSDHTINIEEYAFGDNSDHYALHANYEISGKKFILKKRKLRKLN
jgi:hypothetical protein